MRRKLQLMFIFMCLGALAGYGQGIGDRNRSGDSEGRFTITGRVYMPDGRPAANVKVDIDNTDGAKSYYTNIDGTFQTGSIKAGNYTVSVSYPGLPVEREFVTIDRDSPAGAVLQCRPLPSCRRSEERRLLFEQSSLQGSSETRAREIQKGRREVGKE